MRVADPSFSFVCAQQLGDFAGTRVGWQREELKNVNIQEKHAKLKIQQNLM